MGITLNQLLAEDVLELTMVTPSSSQRLERLIRWVAPTELDDPTPFLRGSELVLTTGAFLKQTDDAAWFEFARRLQKAGVAAVGFGAGLTHQQIPKGLVDACVALEIPLLSVPYHVAFVRINEFVADAIVADRFLDVGRAGTLAAALAHSISNGAPLSMLLRQVADEIQGEAAILDIDGDVVSSWPLQNSWPTADLLRGLTNNGDSGYLAVSLDQAGAYDHILVGRSDDKAERARIAMTAASTLIAIDLNARLQEESSSASRMSDVVSALTDWTTPTATLVRSLRQAGLASDVPTVIVVAHPNPTYSAGYALRLRLAVQQVTPVVRSVRIGELLLLLAQGAEDATEPVLGSLRRQMPGRRIVVAGPARDAEEIRMVLASARVGLDPDQTTPERVRAFDLTSIVAAAAGRGGQQTGTTFLQPLLEHDRQFNGELIATLRAYLKCDAKPIRAAEVLHVHRNTLRYRLDQISKLLNSDLNDLGELLMCSLAFRLHDAGGRV
ncbi:MAG: PucR family transcriptional regulator [Aeromicrobium sp.]|jgi:purine catabolism regulator|nr:PucR family transcriptional regulator [Aeromicrobium sp.]